MSYSMHWTNSALNVPAGQQVAAIDADTPYEIESIPQFALEVPPYLIVSLLLGLTVGALAYYLFKVRAKRSLVKIDGLALVKKAINLLIVKLNGTGAPRSESVLRDQFLIDQFDGVLTILVDYISTVGPSDLRSCTPTELRALVAAEGGDSNEPSAYSRLLLTLAEAQELLYCGAVERAALARLLAELLSGVRYLADSDRVSVKEARDSR